VAMAFKALSFKSRFFHSWVNPLYDMDINWCFADFYFNLLLQRTFSLLQFKIINESWAQSGVLRVPGCRIYIKISLLSVLSVATISWDLTRSFTFC
jgi:hypothetical protein